MQFINKLAEKFDVITGSGVSASLLTSPVWMAALTDWLQLVALCMGLLVGYSTYRLNSIRAEKIQEAHDG